MNEELLIDQLKQGDEAAFKTLVENWQDMVYNTALGIVQNKTDAEDIAQEVFIQAFRSIASFKGESKLSTWLYKITISKALDHERKRRRKKRFAFVKSLFTESKEELENPDDFYHPGVLLDNKEKATVLFKAIERLPANQRIAFTLNKVEGLSHQEISEVMNTSISSVESLLHRAKANLRKWLNEFYRETGQ